MPSVSHFINEFKEYLKDSKKHQLLAVYSGNLLKLIFFIYINLVIKIIILITYLRKILF